ncbi:MAG: hypothetical protein KJ589_05095 [Proteobacteria bacterium]|nr:hypothetical protein [Pseudomonadota bacterium]
MLEEASRLIPDYPGLREDIAALKSSKDQYEAYLFGIEAALIKEDLAKARELLDTFKEVYPHDENVGKLEVSIRKKKDVLRRKAAFKKNLVKIVAAVGLGIVMILAYSVFEFFVYNAANNQWQQVEMYLAQHKYQEALAECDRIVDKLAGVRIFSREDKLQLLAKIDKVRSSEQVVQGASGNLLVDGQYVPKESVEGVVQSKKMIEEADQLLGAGRFSDAVRKYEEVESLISNHDQAYFAESMISVKASKKKGQAGIVKELISQGQERKDKGDLTGALELLAQADSMLKVGGLDGVGSIAKSLAKVEHTTRMAVLEQKMAAGDRLFKEGNYDQAVLFYQDALNYTQVLSPPPSGLAAILEKSISKARVSALLQLADQAFVASQWSKAVDSYQKAFVMASEFGVTDLDGMAQAAKNKTQAVKMITLGTVQKTFAQAEQQRKVDDLAKAGGSFAKVIELIKTSPYAEDEDFAVFQNEADKMIGEVKERIFINGKKDELEERYKGILRKAFSLDNSTVFLNPEIVLVGNDPSRLLFSIMARSYEKKSTTGMYFLYELTYAFDRQSGNWFVVNKNMGNHETKDKKYY